MLPIWEEELYLLNIEFTIESLRTEAIFQKLDLHLSALGEGIKISDFFPKSQSGTSSGLLRICVCHKNSEYKIDRHVHPDCTPVLPHLIFFPDALQLNIFAQLNGPDVAYWRFEASTKERGEGNRYIFLVLDTSHIKDPIIISLRFTGETINPAIDESELFEATNGDYMIRCDPQQSSCAPTDTLSVDSRGEPGRRD